MRTIPTIFILAVFFLTSSCMQKGSNKNDPYEPFNREVYKFNMAFDATMVKPPAKIYKTVIPPPVRTGVTNFFNNVNMVPTIANDLLQIAWPQAIKDSWRLFINSTFGIGGILDPAEKWGLPQHSNDFGITLAKWGVKQSPYIVLPLLGPSTLRDALGMPVDYTVFSPYFYIDAGALYPVLTPLSILDQRVQLFEAERLMDQALDKYSFTRDAYLQNRNHQITGSKTELKSENDNKSIGSLYVEEDASVDYVDKLDDSQKSQQENE